MRRRDFVTFLSGAMAWATAARAQEQRHVISYLGASDPWPGELPAVYQGLKETGFVEGKNLSIEFRNADGHYDRLSSLAAELVGRNVSVILVADVPSAFAAKAATKTIPIVLAIGADPVKVGLVESLSRPNGNLTGVTFFSLFWDRSVWSCCTSFSRPSTRSHCSEILVMRTSNLTCLTFGPQPMPLSNTWRS